MSTDLTGKFVLVTGATGGIGRVTARELARMGAHVVFTSRDPKKAEEVTREIRAQVPNAKVEAILADLSVMSQIREAAADYRRRFARLDILVNNAGAIFSERETTADGLERTFATNHLAYFLLTRELLPLLKQSAPARIVSVSSEAHRRGHMHFDDLNLERGYSPWQAYGQSKLANILFTRELSRQLAGTGVTATCLHPGVVATGFARNRPGLWNTLFGLLSPFLITPEKGAQTTLYLASSPEVEGRTGGYYSRRREIVPTREARDDEAARRLWSESERILAQVLGEKWGQATFPPEK